MSAVAGAFHCSVEVAESTSFKLVYHESKLKVNLSFPHIFTIFGTQNEIETLEITETSKYKLEV